MDKFYTGVQTHDPAATPLLQEMLANDQIRLYKTGAGWCYIRIAGADGLSRLGYEGEEKSIERSLRKKEQTRRPEGS